MDASNDATQQADLEAEVQRLYERVLASDDYATLMSLVRARRRLGPNVPRAQGARAVRVALLGGATTELIEAPLALSLEAIGIEPRIHRAEYNTFAQEMLDPASATAEFQPEVTVLVATPANLPSWPNAGDTRERADQLARETADHWLDLCRRLHERVGCEVVLNNFHRLPTRPLGNLGAKLPWDANNFLRRVNMYLGDGAPPYVHIVDVESLSALHGVRRWFDARYWYHAKQPVSFDCLPALVRNTARVIGALYGRTAKCLVLDLDNTLWGGVVGDDGVEGLRLGEGDAVGEAFKAFQQYVLRLKERGVLLAVCSKNEESNALAGFTHPEMVLRREDFVSFQANWEPKPDNIIRIAREINIGLDSLVFVDDNPAEREHVRQRLPMVKVIDLPEDPADYAIAVDDAGLFEVTAISTEDQQRSRQYAENAARQQLLESSGDYDEYLATLEQKAVIRDFDEVSLDRITQLINKSNQFNLTTLRLTRSQVEERMRDPDALAIYVRLADRFGDNGLISVISGRGEGDELVIDLWLMSCRVLKRGVEKLVCNDLVSRARAMGLARIRGTYLPTARNGLVKKHYASLGFRLVEEREDGATSWVLDVAGYEPFDVPIQVEEEIHA